MPNAQAQITFLYYRKLEPAAAFYEQMLGLERVVDQGWARIYRASGNAYVGIVAGEKGYHMPQPRNAVLVSLVVDDVSLWYHALQAGGAKLLSELQHKEDIGLHCFFVEDPGGYTLEVQQFLDPRLAETFAKA
jgi:predicted enzyme related to lactoylglutathione lyase